ncbi:MAG: hypothetical protein AABW64_04470 [Nanoarchaeota archaeon]
MKSRRLIVPGLVVTALASLGCGSSHSSSPPNKPPVLTSIPNQTVTEGATTTISLNNYISDPEGDPFTVNLLQGPGMISSTSTATTTLHTYSYQDAVDQDITNNQYAVQLEISDGNQNGKVNGMFTVTQIDTIPQQLATQKQLLTSGLEALVLDNFGWSEGAYRRSQTAITIDTQGSPIVFYEDSSSGSYGGRLVSAFVLQNTWIKKKISRGSYLSAATDRNNITHLTYDNDSNYSGGEELFYAWLSNNQWNRRLLNDSGSVGLDNDLTIDANNNVHISYFDWFGNMVEYATNASGSWVLMKDLDQAGWDQTSIAITNQTTPNIVYARPNSTLVHLQQQSTGNWSSSIISQGSNPVVRSDAQSNLHVVFARGNLQHAIQNSNNTWSITPISNTSHDLHQQLSMRIDSRDNSMHVLHIQRGALHYTTNFKGNWQTFPVESQYAYENPDLAIDQQGTLHVSAMRRAGNQIQYITFPPSFFTGN